MKRSFQLPETAQAPTGRRRLRREEGLQQTRPNALRARRIIQGSQPKKRSSPELREEERRHLLPAVRPADLADSEEKVLRGPHWRAQQEVRAPLNLQTTPILQWADPFPSSSPKLTPRTRSAE